MSRRRRPQRPRLRSQEQLSWLPEWPRSVRGYPSQNLESSSEKRSRRWQDRLETSPARRELHDIVRASYAPDNKAHKKRQGLRFSLTSVKCAFITEVSGKRGSRRRATLPSLSTSKEPEQRGQTGSPCVLAQRTILKHWKASSSDSRATRAKLRLLAALDLRKCCTLVRPSVLADLIRNG